MHRSSLARLLRNQRTNLRAYISLLLDHERELDSDNVEHTGDLPEASQEATAAPENSSSDSAALEVQKGSDQPLNVEPASPTPMSPAAASIAALIAMAKEAHEMRTSLCLSIKEVTRRLNRRHGTAFDHSKVGKLLKLDRLLKTYPSLNLKKLRKEDHLLRLLEIPPEHRDEAFTSGTLSTISGTLNIYHAARPTWRVMIKSLRNGARHKKSGAVRTSSIMDLVGDVLGTAWN